MLRPQLAVDSLELVELGRPSRVSLSPLLLPEELVLERLEGHKLPPRGSELVELLDQPRPLVLWQGWEGQQS